jgi:hypothetical protein
MTVSIPSPLRRASRWTSPVGWALLATLVAAGGLQAADRPKTDKPKVEKPRPASFGKAKADGPLLTRAQLRECLAQQLRVRESSEATLKLQTALDSEKSEIARLGALLADKLAALDRSSADAVQAYNTEALARDKLIDAYNARTPEFNARVDALQAERDAFARDCENRNYDELDEDAIKAGK